MFNDPNASFITIIGNTTTDQVTDNNVITELAQLYKTDNELLSLLQENYQKLNLSLLSEHINVEGVTIEIIEKLELDGDNSDNQAIIARRLLIMQAMLELNSDESGASYDHSSDVLRMNSTFWTPIDALDDKGEPALKSGQKIDISKDGGAAFIFSGTNLQNAIYEIFYSNNFNYKIECSTGMQLTHIKALLDFGIEEEELLVRCKNNIYLMPESLHATEEYNNTSASLFQNKILEPKEVSDIDNIVPGDSVYFKNYSDYLERNKGGAWQGEHAIYLVDGQYSGFGVKPKTYDDMIKNLECAYYDFPKKLPKSVKEEKSNQVIGENLPGLCKKTMSIYPEKLIKILNKIYY